MGFIILFDFGFDGELYVNKIGLRNYESNLDKINYMLNYEMYFVEKVCW